MVYILYIIFVWIKRFNETQEAPPAKLAQTLILSLFSVSLCNVNIIIWYVFGNTHLQTGYHRVSRRSPTIILEYIFFYNAHHRNFFTNVIIYTIYIIDIFIIYNILYISSIASMNFSLSGMEAQGQRPDNPMAAAAQLRRVPPPQPCSGSVTIQDFVSV